jgi:hypothetical protein
MPDDLSIQLDRMTPEGEQTISAILNCVSPLRSTNRRCGRISSDARVDVVGIGAPSGMTLAIFHADRRSSSCRQ